MLQRPVSGSHLTEDRRAVSYLSAHSKRAPWASVSFHYPILVGESAAEAGNESSLNGSGVD